MSENDIIIRTHYKSPHRMHIDSDIPTPSEEPINQFARQLITLLDTSDLSSMLSYCVLRNLPQAVEKYHKIVIPLPFLSLTLPLLPSMQKIYSLHYTIKKKSFPYFWKPRPLKLTICEAYWIILNRNSQLPKNVTIA